MLEDMNSNMKAFWGSAFWCKKEKGDATFEQVGRITEKLDSVETRLDSMEIKLDDLIKAVSLIKEEIRSVKNISFSKKRTKKTCHF